MDAMKVLNWIIARSPPTIEILDGLGGGAQRYIIDGIRKYFLPAPAPKKTAGEW